MQIDFHFDVIYVLCRLAGMKSKYAKITAYSSQQVDDATHGHALKFSNGGVFNQTMTAHKTLEIRNLNVWDAVNVWLPFHFLPQGGKNNSDKLITGTNSDTLKNLLEDTLKNSKTPHVLHRLGIALHVFADTYSHQDFVGYYDKHNEITVNNIKKCLTIRDIIKLKVLKIASIGHANTLHYPDLPNYKWSYNK